jgi:hypothetical protein
VSDPWFDPRLAYLLGPVVGVLAPRACVVMLVAAVIGFVARQPRIIWYSLGIAGGIGTTVFRALAPVVLLRYRQAEARRIAAGDL